MGKGVRVKYHSFDMDGAETVHERAVCRVRITAIPVSVGEDNFLVLCTDRKTRDSYSRANLELIVPPSEFNFIEFNGGTYRLRNSSDLDICCRWIFYNFEFHIDIDDIIDGIKIPVIHLSNDGKIECDEDKVIELFEERKKLLELYRSKKEEIKVIKNKIAKYSEIQCIGLNEKIAFNKNYIENSEE